MSFELFGFEKIGDNYGFWLCNIKNWDADCCRSLFSFYVDEGWWGMDLCFIQLRGL